jgi:hypothetical protein
MKAWARRCSTEEPEGADAVRAQPETVLRGEGNEDGMTLRSQRNRARGR